MSLITLPSRFAPLLQLAPSPQGGFSSTVHSNP